MKKKLRGVTVHMTPELVERAENLVIPVSKALEDQGLPSAKRSTVISIAVRRGIKSLEEEHGVK